MDATPMRLMEGGARPRGGRIALMLQGGGALGAYQAGVFEALEQAGLVPDRIAGVSIGSINGAIIAGSAPECRVAHLREFWETVTSRPVWPPAAPGVHGRRAFNAWSAWLTTLFGQPGFFSPGPVNPWLAPRGTAAATRFYDTAPLRETLERLVDFDRLNAGDIRFAAGAVNVATGNFAYFDTDEVRIGVDHILASGALPPALPSVAIGGERYWDGGLVSNTPLQHLLQTAGEADIVAFQVDLFSARGRLPADMPDVLTRQKDIMYSSRTRLVTDQYVARRRLELALKRLLDAAPEETLDEGQRAMRRELSRLPALSIIQLVYQQAAYEGQAKDFEFSASSMEEHWARGRADTAASLAQPAWLDIPTGARGIVTHDIHRVTRG